MPSSALPPPPPATAEDGGEVPTGVWAPQVRLLTAGLVLTITLVAFESLAIATVMPTVEDDLGGLALYGWVFSGFFLANLLGVVLAGHAADRRGLAPPFATGLALFAAGLVVGGLAPSMPVLVAARLAQGFGAGAIPAVAYAAVGRGYPAALRPRVFAVFSSAWVIPGIAGPALATLIERAASWRAVFLSLLPLVAVAAAMALPGLRAYPARVTGRGEERSSTRWALVLVAGVGAVLAAPSGPPPGLALLLGFAGAPLAVWAFTRLVPSGTLALRPGLPATIGVRGLLTFAFFSADAYVSLAVVDGRGGSTLLAGAALSAAAVAWTTGAWIQARLLAVVGPRRLDTIGFAVVLGGVLAMLAVALGLPVWASLPAWGLGGLGMGLAYAPLSVTVLAAAPRGQEGAATAALQLSDTLGVSLGTGVGGALVALGDRQGWPVATGVALAFATSAVVAALGVLAARRLPARVPEQP